MDQRPTLVIDRAVIDRRRQKRYAIAVGRQDGIVRGQQRRCDRELRFLSTVTTFGTAVDITLAELSIEAFLPADDETAAALTR